MFTTKQILSSNRFSQATGDTLTLSGGTKVNGLTGITNHFGTVKGYPNLNILTSNLLLSEDPTVAQSGAYISSYVIGGGFSAAPTALVELSGKLYFGGGFVKYNNITGIGGILALNDDETKYELFNHPVINGAVNHILNESGNKLFITGAFTQVSGVTANRVVRLNANGTRDITFNSGTGFNNLATEVVKQGDGKYVIIGNFTTYSGVTRNRIVRVNNDGSLDTSFNLGAGFSTTPTDVALQSDGKIIVGGLFTTFSGVTTNRIVRINSNGTRDNTFNIGSGFNNAVNEVLIQPDGKILVSGAFTQYSGVTANRIIRLNTNGSIDTSFNVGSGFGNNNATTMCIDTNGKIVVAGNFTSYSGVTVNLAVRLNSNGTLDTSFSVPSLLGGATVNTIIQRANGNYVLIATNLFGTISSLNKRRFVVELDQNGGIVNRFALKNAGFNTAGSVSTVKVLQTNKLLVAGNFTTYDEASAAYFIRINTDTSLDNTFNGQNKFNVDVQSIEFISGETKMIVGGNFSQYNNIDRVGIVKLNIDGSLDTSFVTGNAGFGGSVNSTKQTLNGKILVGGGFTSYSGQTRMGIARLLSNGNIDTSFNPAQLSYAFSGGTSTGSYMNPGTRKVYQLNDGGVLMCGGFELYDDGDLVPSEIYLNNSVIKLTTNGLVDFSYGYPNGLYFNGGTSNSVLLPDESLILVGGFDSYNTDPTGGIPTTVNRIIKLTNSGLVDTTFLSNIGSGFDGPASAISIDSNGDILVGGTFTSFNGHTCNGLVKIGVDGSLKQTLDVAEGFDGSQVINEITEYMGNILVAGSFSTFRNNQANNLVLIGNANSGLTVNYVKGIKYKSDISSNLDDLSLTPKKYVVDSITTLNTTIQSKLDILTGNTSPNTYVQKSVFSTYTGTTVPTTYLTKTAFNVYSGVTTNRINAIINNNYVTGATSLGGNTVIGTKSGNNLRFKGLVAGNNISLVPTSTGITISTTSGLVGAVTGATNGLVKKNSNVGLGGTITGATTIQFNGNSGQSYLIYGSTKTQTAIHNDGFGVIVDDPQRKLSFNIGSSIFLGTWSNSAIIQSFLITTGNTGISQFYDGRTVRKGIEYSFLNPSGFTNNSLVHKKYVDDAIVAAGGGGGGTVTGATNGLRMSSGGRRTALGGILTGSTTIGLGTNNLIFTGTTGTLRYGANYSSNFVNRSLVDVSYVTGITTTLQTKTAFNSFTGTTLSTNYARKNVAQSFTGKQTFTPTGTDSGINLGSFSGNSSSSTNGDVYYNTTINDFRGRISGQWSNFTRPESVTLTGTTVVLNESYRNKILYLTSSSNITVRGGNISTFYYTTLVKAGLGNVTFAATGSTTLDAVDTTIYTQNTAASFYQRSSTKWSGFGSLGTGTTSGGGGGVGTVTGATNGLRMSGGGRRTALGGPLTGSTTIGLGTNNLTFTGTTGTLRYGSDLSAQFNVRSLVDVGYVTGITTQQREITGTTYTVAARDKKYLLYFTHPAGCLVTIPNIAVNFEFTGSRKDGAGIITFTGSGVTLKSTGNQLTASKTSASWIQKTVSEWYGYGAFGITGVTSLISGINGLSMDGSGTKVKLGGTITGATTIGLGSNNLIITGSTGTLRYGSNLSAQFNVRSLVDKGYVTGLTTSLLTTSAFNTYSGNTGIAFANNGLTKVTNRVRLGGNLTGATTIGLGTSNLTFSGTTGTLRYAGNYSASFVNRSLVDVSYVTGLTNTLQTKASITIYTGTTAPNLFISGATNGLSKQGRRVRLGGIVTGTTTIGLGTNNLIFTGTTGTIRYGSNLSANYNVRSLVDVGYVTGLTTSLSTKDANVKTVGASNYVVTSADSDFIIEFSGSTNRTITFTASALTTNFKCSINNLMTTNTVTVVAGPGTTLQLTGTILASQYAGASIYRRGNNIRGFGNLS